VSPALSVPLPALYVAFAFEPDSRNVQPAGSAELVPAAANVLKSCAAALFSTVRLTCAEAVVRQNNINNVATTDFVEVVVMVAWLRR
jgi:hypothetical protein